MTSERVAAIEPNGRCLDVVNGSNLKSATPVESTEVTMTSTDVRTVSSTAESPMPGPVDVKFEVVVLPVSATTPPRSAHDSASGLLKASIQLRSIDHEYL